MSHYQIVEFLAVHLNTLDWHATVLYVFLVFHVSALRCYFNSHSKKLHVLHHAELAVCPFRRHCCHSPSCYPPHRTFLVSCTDWGRNNCQCGWRAVPLVGNTTKLVMMRWSNPFAVYWVCNASMWRRQWERGQQNKRAQEGIKVWTVDWCAERFSHKFTDLRQSPDI